MAREENIAVFEDTVDMVEQSARLKDSVEKSRASQLFIAEHDVVPDGAFGCGAFSNSPRVCASGRAARLGGGMYEVRVEADFAAAHFLRDYHGKCENLHGHNYKVYAHVRGAELDEGGMLLDFTRLKGALRSVCKGLDHTNLNDNSYFRQNPSAERIARFIYEGVVAALAAEGTDVGSEDARVRLFAVDVFETETSRARYSADGMR